MPTPCAGPWSRPRRPCPTRARQGQVASAGGNLRPGGGRSRLDCWDCGPRKNASLPGQRSDAGRTCRSPSAIQRHSDTPLEPPFGAPAVSLLEFACAAPNVAFCTRKSMMSEATPTCASGLDRIAGRRLKRTRCACAAVTGIRPCGMYSRL
jgi:hypothetical protein